MIQPRQYQVEAVNSIYQYFQHNRGNPLIAMPTGTGKSIVIAMFLQSVFNQYPKQRVMILTHVKELIEQNVDKLITLWPFAPAGVYSAGLRRRDTFAPITFGGIASVRKHSADFGHIDLVLIDEAHLVSPNDATMYQTFLGELKQVNPKLKVIGFTATPWRLGHGKLTDPSVDKEGNETPSLFTDIAFDITGLEAFNRLIGEGYLAPLIPKRMQMTLEVDGVHMRGGEFIQAELQLAVDKTELTERAVREAMELGADRRHWLVFAAGVEHAIHTAEIMQDAGIAAVAVHSKMSSAERDEAIAGFKAGKYLALVNNNILTTGFDFPGIDLILCLRPTASPVLWVQMLGRGTRPAPGKENCLVLDFAGNTRRLGPINDPVVPKRKGKGGGTAPVKECPCCQSWVHASLRFCDGIMKDGSPCTHEFKFQTKLRQSASSAELIKGDIPKVEEFQVDHITYTLHTKLDRPPMIKVSYYCGLRMFQEFVCIQHEGWAGRKALEWWRKRWKEDAAAACDYAAPVTTADALGRVDELETVQKIKVWVNKKFPEILSISFDGTYFEK